jgi:hypothetical protein
VTDCELVTEASRENVIVGEGLGDFEDEGADVAEVDSENSFVWVFVKDAVGSEGVTRNVLVCDAEEDSDSVSVADGDDVLLLLFSRERVWDLDLLSDMLIDVDDDCDAEEEYSFVTVRELECERDDVSSFEAVFVAVGTESVTSFVLDSVTDDVAENEPERSIVIEGADFVRDADARVLLIDCDVLGLTVIVIALGVSSLLGVLLRVVSDVSLCDCVWEPTDFE